MSKIPAAWMPKANIQRIHLHWTGSDYKANGMDLNSYHLLIEGGGKLVRGNGSIARNSVGEPSNMVSHTLNANAGAIGVSICAMKGAQESPFNAGPCPLTKVQWNAAVAVIAQLAKQYGISVRHSSILTHAEVGANLGIAQKGKWDIARLPFDLKVVGASAVGNKLRKEVAVALDKLAGAKPSAPSNPALKLPRFKVSGVKPSTLTFRRTPDGEKVGALAEGATVERLAVKDGWWQVRTAKGYVGWVWSGYLVQA